MKTTLIIFSKDRTLQLKSLLLSIKQNYDIPEKDIFIIYKNTIPEISFDSLKKEFQATFMEQRNFLQDIKEIVYNSNSEYIQFMVDDLIIPRTINLDQVENFLDEHNDIDSFCFRMGQNIKCGIQPEFEFYDNNILAWETSKQWGKHWNYAWDLSSSLYRKRIVTEYLKKCRHNKETFPNPFEDHFYTCMPSTAPRPLIINIINGIRFCFRKKSMKIACFSESKCFTQGVNLVANIKGDDRDQQFDPISLHKKMIDGFVIDFESLRTVKPEEPNAGHIYFKLRKVK